MIWIVCGGRDYADKEILFKTLDDLIDTTDDIVIEGGAPGADTLAGEWAQARGVNFLVAPALWGFHGPKAGPLRNHFMGDIAMALGMSEYADPDTFRVGRPGIVAFPGGRGTSHMVKDARSLGFKIYIVAEDGTRVVIDLAQRKSLFGDVKSS